MTSDDAWTSTGWWRPARRVPSPNHGPRPVGQTVRLVVVHSISLPPGRYGGPEVEAFFQNRLDWTAHPFFEQIRGLEVSAHFFVRRDGEVVQCVATDRRAWHAGRSSWQGQDNCNDYSVGIELEGSENDGFEPAQYTALVSLLRALAQRYPALQAVAGHEHVAPGRKTDPGPGFDWAVLQTQLGWSADRFASLAAASIPVAAKPFG
jgi:N-acetyl-anhydromuramoyl-L-alanine amidase